MSIQGLGGGGGEVKFIQDNVSRSCTFKIGEAAIHFVWQVPCAEVLPVFVPRNFCAKFCARRHPDVLWPLLFPRSSPRVERSSRIRSALSPVQTFANLAINLSLKLRDHFQHLSFASLVVLRGSGIPTSHLSLHSQTQSRFLRSG